VSKGISGFYRKIYELQELDLEEGDFYDNCPKLSQAARYQMDMTRFSYVLNQAVCDLRERASRIP
jgi:hypothetical protein